MEGKVTRPGEWCGIIQTRALVNNSLESGNSRDLLNDERSIDDEDVEGEESFQASIETKDNENNHTWNSKIS
jgi:hypothetical protein